MKILKLRRITRGEDETFGVLLNYDIPLCLTLELPWKNNEHDISCIPAGEYMCRRFQSDKYGSTFKLMSVPDRGDIEFHWGNTVENTKGCILTGTMFGILKGKPAVYQSRRAFRELMYYLKSEDEIALIIEDCE